MNTLPHWRRGVLAAMLAAIAVIAACSTQTASPTVPGAAEPVR